MEINADLYELLIAQGAPTDKAMAAAGGDRIYKNLATKDEIAGVKTEIANEFKGLYRYLWGMAAGIVTVILSGIGAGILVLNMLAS